MQFARSSSACDIPISPTSARFRSVRLCKMSSSKILNLSSSCSSTIWVGWGTSNFFLILKTSNNSGNFSWMSDATFPIYSSRLMPPASPPSEVYIISVLSHSSLTELLKYWISAFEWSPKTPGLVKRGIFSISTSISSFVSASVGMT